MMPTAEAGTVNTGSTAFSNIAVLNGSGSDTLVGRNLVNDWQVTGMNSGTVTAAASTITFTDMANLQGNTNRDDFTVQAAGSVTGELRGEGGNDILVVETDGANNTLWTINGTESGTVTNRADFTGMQALVGGSGVDDFTIASAFNGSISSLGGADIIVVNANVNNTIDLGTDDDQIDIGADVTNVIGGIGNRYI